MRGQTNTAESVQYFSFPHKTFIERFIYSFFSGDLTSKYPFSVIVEVELFLNMENMNN